MKISWKILEHYEKNSTQKQEKTAKIINSNMKLLSNKEK